MIRPIVRCRWRESMPSFAHDAPIVHIKTTTNRYSTAFTGVARRIYPRYVRRSRASITHLASQRPKGWLPANPEFERSCRCRQVCRNGKQAVLANMGLAQL